MEGSAGDDEVARYPNGSLLDIHQRSGIGSDWWMPGPYPTIPEVRVLSPTDYHTSPISLLNTSGAPSYDRYPYSIFHQSSASYCSPPVPDTLDVVEPASDYRALIETDRREPEPHLNHFGATLYPWSWDKNATDHPPSLRNVSPLSDASPLSSAPSLSSCPSLSSGTSLRSRPSSYSACSISSGSSWSRLDSGLGSERNSWDGGPGPKVLRYEADKPVHQQQQQGRAVFIEDNATSRGKPDANGESRLAYVRPTPSRILCPRCNDYPEGFRGAHEFRRHMDRAHVTKPKVWITVDISPEKTFLAKCKACVTGKKYRAYSSAAAHLRRVHFIPRKRGRGAETNERRGMTGNNHPPMDILRMWLKKVEDVIGEAPVMAQPGGLDLEVSKQTRESPEHMDELGITRRTGSPSQRGTFPIINSFVGDFQEGFPEETYHGYYGGVGAPWQDSPNLYMDQHHEQNYGTGLVIPWAQQPMITSPYCSDSPVEFDKQRKSTVQPDAGESGNCDSTGPPKVGEAKSSSQKIIKKEIFDQDIYMKSDSPNSTCDDSNIKKEKMRSFKTLDEQQDLQELKGIDEKGVFAKEDPSSSSKDNQKPYPEDIKASVSPHYAAHQLAKKIENVDKGYQKYLREPDRSEILPNVLAAGQQADIDYEKKYARFMFEAFHHWTMTESKYMPSTKSGPELGTSSSSLGTQSKPLISFYVGKGNHSKHRDTLPLPFGHPKSGQWTQMLPLIKACTKDIMGKGNGGALELFVLDGEPTICVTCWDPSKLNLALLKKCMEPLGLGISVAKGKVRRSAGNEHDESGDQGILGDRPWSLPSIHGHYMAQPTCGASLGTSEGPFKDGKVSLGGYLKIKHLHRGEWSYYAMTVHHVLVDSKHKQSCSPNMNGCEDVGEDEDQEMADAGYDTSPGVCNGVYSVGEDSMKKIMFSSPAVLDGKDLVSRLENRRIMRRANEDYASIDSLDNLDTVLHAVGTSDSTMFGSAAWSSGLCLDQDVEMDWLLIGDIPANRIGCNTPGDVSAYMEGNHNTYGQSQRCWTPSTYVDGPAFDTLMGFSTREWGKPGSQGGYLSRVFGRGSESGLADGFLSPHSSVFYDPEYGSYDAWAFSPRYQYGLGDSGDSGTWIFTAEGKLLGQIISYNRARHITYYTPICKIFNHIKRVTGATEVELLLPDDVPGRSLPPLKSAYGLLSPAGISPNADGPSTRTASEDPLSKDSSQAKPVITPPRSPHSERLAPLNMRSSRTLFGEKALELVPAQSDGWTFDSTMLRTFDDVQSLGNPYPW